MYFRKGLILDGEQWPVLKSEEIGSLSMFKQTGRIGLFRFHSLVSKDV